MINQEKRKKIGKVTGEWFQISWKDKTGYAFSSFLSAGSPISIDGQKPLKDQIQKVCFGSKDEPPLDCSGQCGNTYFILDANHNYLRAEAGGPPERMPATASDDRAGKDAGDSTAARTRAGKILS